VKPKITAVAFSTLVACVAGSAAFAATSFNDLKFTTNDWYAAQATSLNTMSANGAWAEGPTSSQTAVSSWDDKTNYVNGAVCIEVDTDQGEALTFTPSTAWSSANKIISMDFNVYAATVPYSVTPVDTAKVGFAIRDIDGNNTRTYIAFNGSSWIQLVGSPVEEGTSYKLTIQIDSRSNTQYARFLVNDSELSSATTNWIALASAVGSSPKLGFVGMGYFSSIEGDQFTITAEDITVPGAGTVTIAEATAAAAETAAAAAGKTVEQYLASDDTAGGNKVIDNIVLGLRDSTGLKDSGQLIAKGDSDIGSSDATKIKVGLNATAPADSGATITYGMYGSDTGAFSGEETLVGSTTTDASTLSIPLTGTTYKYYKVKATIAY